MTEQNVKDWFDRLKRRLKSERDWSPEDQKVMDYVLKRPWSEPAGIRAVKRVETATSPLPLCPVCGEPLIYGCSAVACKSVKSADQR